MGKKNVRCSLFAVLLTFTSEYGVCDLGPVRRAIEKLPSKVAHNKVMCIEYRGLSQRTARSLQVKPPALMFRILRSTRMWIAYLERYKDKRGIEHHELRIIDGSERAKQTNGRWSEVHKGVDPIKFLQEVEFDSDGRKSI